MGLVVYALVYLLCVWKWRTPGTDSPWPILSAMAVAFVVSCLAMWLRERLR